jgi:hypothetical protein
MPTSLPPIVVAVLGGLVFWMLIEFGGRWLANRMASRVVDQVLYPERYKSESRPALEPESRFIIHLSDSEIVCQRPEGAVERVLWTELQKLELLTTRDGPFAPDAFWVLHGMNSGCVVPLAATGGEELLKRLQTLPGFDNGALIEATSCTSDRTILCWQSLDPLAEIR